MFQFFRRSVKNTMQIDSPVKGHSIDITDVNDQAFSKKLMGDGMAVIPQNCLVKAPCSGTVTMLFPTKHAFGITTDDGIEILVHIGLDTVNLRGIGFTAYHKVNDRVHRGNLMIEFDNNMLIDEQLDMTIMIVLTNTNGYLFEKRNLDAEVESSDVLFARRSEESS